MHVYSEHEVIFGENIMRRQTQAIALILTGLALGIIGQFFFYRQSLGLSVPLFAILLLSLILIYAWRYKLRLSIRKLWLIIPIIFFAVMFALRANPFILLLDGLACLSLMALFLHYLNHETHADNASTQDHMKAIIDTSVNSMTFGGRELSHSWQWLRNRQLKTLSPFVAVARGLLITIPIIIVFAILFSSADAIFSARVDNLLNLISFDTLESLGWRTLLIIVIAWLTIGALSDGLTKRSIARISLPLQADDTPVSLTQEKQQKFSLGMTETSIILLGVAVLFAFFVSIQLTYFFAGELAIAEGLSYSSYARRGFFELLAASTIILGLLLVLDYLTTRQKIWGHIIFLSLSVIIVALTLVIMVSAWQRMVLYEQAYGFTFLRVYSHVFIIWLAPLLLFALLHLFRVKSNIFALGAILMAIGYLGTLNMMNVDHYIAIRNIERYHQGEELDVCYLRQLSVDALPAIFDLYNTSDEAIQADLTAWLISKQPYNRARFRETSIFEWNLAHYQAWHILDSLDLRTIGTTRACGYYSYN